MEDKISFRLVVQSTTNAPRCFFWRAAICGVKTKYSIPLIDKTGVKFLIVLSFNFDFRDNGITKQVSREFSNGDWTSRI